MLQRSVTGATLRRPIVRPRFAYEKVDAAAVPAKMGFGWWYFLTTLGAWVFTPEIRRLVDWHSEFHAIQLLSIVPLLMMLPLLLPLPGVARVPYDRRVLGLVLLWVGSFTYPLCIAVAEGNRVAGTYDWVTFCFPAIAALWLSGQRIEPGVAIARIVTAVTIFAAIASVYGIIQYVAISPWDALWMRSAHIDSIGQPAPFKVRIFSVLNSPGTLADFLFVALFLGFYHLRGRRLLWTTPVLVISIITLALTLIRTAWVAVPIALFVYILMTPHRTRALGGLLLLVLVVAGTGQIVSSQLGSGQWASTLTDRVTSFGNLDTDASAQSRRSQTQAYLDLAVVRPLGQGLGVLGTSGYLTHGGNDDPILIIDNGFLSRFVEMGYVGFTGFIVTLIAGMALSFRVWIVATMRKQPDVVNVAAISVAIQVSFFVMEISGDVHSLINGVFFWIAVALTVPYIKVTESAFKK